MPALIVDGMQYERGEVPVFLARFYRLAPMVDSDEIKAVPMDVAEIGMIRFSHFVRYSTFSELAFEPVGGIVDVEVPLSTLFQQPVDAPAVFAETTTAPFLYNFLFIPGGFGHAFYPMHGAYKTVFDFLGHDGKVIESVTYRSSCEPKHATATVASGGLVRIVGQLWTKQLADSGTVSFAGTRPNIREVFRTVLKNGQPLDAPVPLGVGCVKLSPAHSPEAFIGSGIDAFAWNFEHTFETNIFPGPGDYVLRFTFDHLDGSPPGVAEKGIKVIA